MNIKLNNDCCHFFHMDGNPKRILIIFSCGPLSKCSVHIFRCEFFLLCNSYKQVFCNIRNLHSVQTRKTYIPRHFLKVRAESLRLTFACLCYKLQGIFLVIWTGRNGCKPLKCFILVLFRRDKAGSQSVRIRNFITNFGRRMLPRCRPNLALSDYHLCGP